MNGSILYMNEVTENNMRKLNDNITETRQQSTVFETRFGITKSLIDNSLERNPHGPPSNTTQTDESN